MKKLVIFLFCAAPFLARAITTTLEYEDRRDAEGRAAISNEIARAVAPLVSTNDLDVIVTNLQTQIENAAPADYASVSKKAMSAVQTETDPTVPSWAKASSKPSYTLNEVAPNSENWLGVQGDAGRHIKVLAGTSGGNIVGGLRVTASMMNDNNMTTYTYGGVAVKRNGVNTDYLWDATSNNGVVRRSEMSSKADASDVTSLQAQVTSIGAHLNAEDARFIVTNYNSSVAIPEAAVEVNISNEWITVWNESTRWNWLTGTYLPINFYTKTQIDTALDGKADRAWGFYDSHTGGYAPDGYTWLSSPKIAIAGGLAYQRTLTAEGAVWVLESNGLVTETGGIATNGFFRISDDEGNALFEIIKGNKRTVGAQAGSVETSASYAITHLYITYNVVSESHPTLRITNSLSTPDWKAEDDANCLANVSWTGSSGDWQAEVWGKTAQSQLFVKAEYEVGGETYIKNTAPVGMSTLVLNGVSYSLGTATISGNTVLTLTPLP